MSAISRKVRISAATAAWVIGLSVCLSARADTNIWTGASGGVWSVAGNWSLGHTPTSSEDVLLSNTVAFTSIVDQNFTINRLLYGGNSTVKTLNASGGSTLTVNGMGKVGSESAYNQINVPIILGTDANWVGNAYGGGYVQNVPITGNFTLILTNGSATQFQLLATNTFSALNIQYGSVRFNDGGLGVGPVTMGSGTGSGNAVLFPNSDGVYSSVTNTITVAAGAGARQIANQSTLNDVVTLPATWILNKDLQFALGQANSLYTLTGPISGSGGIAVQHAAAAAGSVVVLAGLNTYSGATTISNGFIRVANGYGIGDQSAVTLYNLATAGLVLSNANETIGSLAGGGASGGNVDVGSYTLTTGGNNNNTTFGGVISGSGNLIKVGTGKMILTGTNTISGTATVNAGTLQVDGLMTNLALTQVNAGGTLGGVGRVGDVNVDGGGTLAPGDSPGVLHLGNLTLASNATFAVELAGSGVGNYDQVDATGAINLSNSVLQISLSYTPTVGETFTIITNEANNPIQGTFWGLTNNAFLDASMAGHDGYFRINYFGNGGNDVVLIATIPEPSAVIMAGCAAAVLAVILRRRR